MEGGEKRALSDAVVPAAKRIRCRDEGAAVKARFQTIDNHIGRGTYGVIAKAVDLETQEQVAIKRVKMRQKLPDDKGGSLGDSTGIHFTVIREIKIMTELAACEHVMGVTAIYRDDDAVCMVMPLMKSDLRKLFDTKMSFPEPQVKCVMQQMLVGLKELHSFHTMHRDLAPANVFINSKGICKLADFGLSRLFGEATPVAKTDLVVTLWYRAPELLFGARFYSSAIDIWSVGCIFAELLCSGRPLFPGTNEIEQLGRIFQILGTPLTGADSQNESLNATAKQNEYWENAELLPKFMTFSYAPRQNLRSIIPHATSLALDLLQQMLRYDPAERPLAADLLQHPYFSEPPLACTPHELPLHLL